MQGYNSTVAKSSFLWIMALVFVTGGCGTDGGGNPGGGNPGDDVGDDCDKATSISENSKTDGSLEGLDDFDFFKVTLLSGGTLYAHTTGTTDTLGAILDEDCGVVNQNDDSGSDINFDLSFPVFGGGTFYIAVAGATEEVTGDYTLHVGFTPDGGQPVMCHLSAFLTSDWEQQDLNKPNEPPKQFTGEENILIVINKGTWNGNTFSGTRNDDDLQFTISGDRSNIESLTGKTTHGSTFHTVVGSKLPVTTDSILLSTLKATVEGPATCDYVDSYTVTGLDPGVTLLGFRCDAKSYLTIYCD